LPRNAIDRRDRALILLGFAGAMKRGALVAISVGDLRFTDDALIVQVRAVECAKPAHVSVDTAAATPARQIAIPITGGDLCAGTAIRDYLLKSALDAEPPESPLFRSCDRGGDATRNRLEAAVVSLIVKKWVAAAGVDPRPYSAQSLVTGRRGEFAKGVL
jgi:integrase